jgi:hypothetical protein
VPDYVGWLVQRKSTKKKLEPQVHFLNFRYPLQIGIFDEVVWLCLSPGTYGETCLQDGSGK